MATTIPVSQAGRFVGRSIFFYFKLGLVSLFVIYLLIHAILLGIQSKDITVTIMELGSEFLNPLVNAQETSIKITSGQSGIMDYWQLYYNLFWIFIWIRLLLVAWGWTPVSNESNKFNNLMLAIGSFLIVQLLAIAISVIISGDKDISKLNIVWKAWVDIFKAFMFLFTEQKYEIRFWKFFNSFQSNNTCVNEICTA